MNPTWLLLNENNFTKKIINNVLFLLFHYNVFFCNSILFTNVFEFFTKYFSSILNTKFQKRLSISLKANYSKILNKYNNFSFFFQINSINFLNSNSLNSQDSRFFYPNNSMPDHRKNLNLFKLIFFFSFNSSTHSHRFFHQSNNFFLNYSNNKLFITNVNKFFTRWNNSFNLVLSFFFYNLNPLIFANNLHKDTTLSINWSLSNWDISLWRYYFPFFVYKTKKNSLKADFFYEKLKSMGFSVLFLLDPLNHFKNFSYYKKYDYYTLGLTPITMNPWLVDYPIIVFSDNFMIQLFFLKFINYAHNQSINFKYSLYKKYWKNSFFFNKIKLLIQN